MIDDLISRLAEIRSEYNCFDENEELYYRALSGAIKILSRRADGDIISRQAAIDGVKRLSLGETDALRLTLRIEDYLKRLASAQQDAVEVVRCKDCKHQEKFFHEDKRIKEGGYYIVGCELVDGYSHVCFDDDFCSRAERKEE